MKFRHLNRLIALIFFAAATSSAQASIVDFQVVQSCYSPTCTNVQGYNFTFTADGWGVSNDNNDYFNQNSSIGLLAVRGGIINSVTMTSVNSGVFDLGSLDAAAGLASFAGTAGLYLTGSLTGGGTVSQALVISKDWNSYTLNGFQNLTQIVFNAGNPIAGFGIDNLNTANVSSNVPEPGTCATLLAGLGLMGFMVRRRKTS